jgi:pyridoxal phosphate enzyme (YggS family)
MPIAANLKTIQQRMTAACARSGRPAKSVRLLAVSKTVDSERIAAAVAAGQKLFGENYVQEFVAKQAELSADLHWHFIGALQSNKVKYLAGKVSMIHSVDRLSLAKEIDRQWQHLNQRIDILLQVNVGDETSKAGVAANDLETLVRAVAALPNLRVCGLMALPPYSDDAEATRPWFRQLRHLAAAIDALALPGVEMSELSMGMSHDFEVAIEEGATLVRVGTALFGERVYS